MKTSGTDRRMSGNLLEAVRMTTTTNTEKVARELIGIGDVARMCCCSNRHITRMTNARRMPQSLKIGNKLVRWRKSEILEWIAAGCPDGGA